jgi:hypothetical protein
VRDLEEFFKATAPARAELKNSFNHKWVPDMQKIHDKDREIIEEVVEFPWKGDFDHRDIHKRIANETHGINHPEIQHPQPNVSKYGPKNLLAVGGYNLDGLSTAEATAAGIAVFLGMLAVAHISNKQQAKAKTIEFDVTDLEMSPKKESKKQIKKTLKSIMKSSNTKVTLMDN